MAVVKYVATKLAGTGKKGILTPDENGYYTLPVGGLNAFNSAGQYYLMEGAKQLFDSSSSLMRRIANGCLKGEVGHPKMTPGMREEAYINRILTIDETNVCCHFKEIWLDDQYGKTHPEFKNPNLVGIMAKVKPAGPKGDFLEKAFQNPNENVCFSIRSFTKDFFERGQSYRVLQRIETFDYVTEPGIASSTKWSSPALESLGESFVTRQQIANLTSVTQSLVATEDTKIKARELLEAVDRSMGNAKKPLYQAW